MAHTSLLMGAQRRLSTQTPGTSLQVLHGHCVGLEGLHTPTQLLKLTTVPQEVFSFLRPTSARMRA